MKILKYFLSFIIISLFSLKSFAGQVSCIDSHGGGGGGVINGRLSAEAKLHQSKHLQHFDVSVLNLKNNSTALNNSLAQTNSAISVTLDDFDNFSAAGKSWLWYKNANASFTMNIGIADNTNPQTWALPSNFLTYFEGAGRGDFVSVSQVPVALRITGANKYMRTAFYDENDQPMNVYDQYNLANDGVFHVGGSYDLEVGSDDTFDEDDFEVADVPLDLSDNFSSTNEETDYVTNQKTLKEVFSVTVDAFGSITTPSGTYNCLRTLTVLQKYTRPNESSSYTLVSTTNHVTFFTKTGEYFTAKVSATSGNVTVSEIEYRTVVPTSSLSENTEVKLNNDSKGVTINADNDTAHPSAILDIKSSNKGVLIPRVTQANRPANPADGLLIYQIDGTKGLYVYINGTGWLRLATD